MPSPRPVDPPGALSSHSVRDKAFQLIKERSFAKGQFKLASGKESNYYLDLKPTMLNPDGGAALSQMILDVLKDMKVDYVGGLEMGAVPLIASITTLSAIRHAPLHGFFVRKDVKDHGTKKLVEGLARGESIKDKRVVILEDVTTSGASAMVAVKAAQELGAVIVLVLSIVDREDGASELYKNAGVPFKALFTASEFLAAS